MKKDYTKKDTNKQVNEKISYAESAFSIEVSRGKGKGQEYNRDFFNDAGQYSTSGRIEKSLVYVIKRK